MRTITGAFFIGAIIGSLLLGHFWFALLFMIFTAVGLFEFYKLTTLKGFSPLSYGGTLTGGILFLASYLHSTGHWEPIYYLLLIPCVFGIFITELFRKSTNPIENIALTLMGIFYVALPFSLLNYLVYANVYTYYYPIVLGIFIIMWTNDTFAYLTGISLGKHRMFERISPKKSWEGFAGGFLFALGASYILSLFYPVLPYWGWMIVSAIITVFGTLGDFIESMFKRETEVKDSGTLLPGHGGLLDRFDSLLLAIPFIFLFLYFVLFPNS